MYLRAPGSTIVAFGAVGQGSPVGTMPPKRDKWIEVKDDDEDDSWGNWGSESSCSQSTAGGSVHTEAAAVGPTTSAASSAGTVGGGVHTETTVAKPSPFGDVRVKQDPATFKVTRIVPGQQVQQAPTVPPTTLAHSAQPPQAPRPQTPRAKLAPRQTSPVTLMPRPKSEVTLKARAKAKLSPGPQARSQRPTSGQPAVGGSVRTETTAGSASSSAAVGGSVHTEATAPTT